MIYLIRIHIIYLENDQNPEDFSYLYSGYAPLSVRIIDSIQRLGVDSVKVVPGPGHMTKNISPHQSTSINLSKNHISGDTAPFITKNTSSEIRIKKKDNTIKKRILVVFLGGCTSAEMSALRWLSGQDRPSKIIFD